MISEPKGQKGSPRIVALTEEPQRQTKASTRTQKLGRHLLALSFFFFVALPAVLGGYYLIFVESERYAASAGFSVRGVEASGGLDGIGALTGLASSGSTVSDSYIILKYLDSRDLVENLETQVNLRQAFSGENIDSLSRLDDNVVVEDLVKYWRSMISTSFDSTTGVVEFEVQAYSAREAQRIAELVLKYTQDLVNGLSENARQDSLRFAEAEVERSEARMRKSLANIRDFRSENGLINPAVSAELDIELIGSLEQRLIEVRGRMRAISDSVDADAPSLVALKRQAEVLEEQIAKQTYGIGNASEETVLGSSMSEILETYETLELEKTFSEQAFASSLASLEKSRVEAGRQQRYLAIYSFPALPQSADYPKRTQNVFMLVLVLALAWAIGALICYAVADHMS